MPENNFEKQVQDIFSEMRMKPSAEVWPKVQEKIKKDKDRRRFFLWLSAAVLLLSAGGYWLLSPSLHNDATLKNTIAHEKAADESTLHNSTTSPANNNIVSDNAAKTANIAKQSNTTPPGVDDAEKENKSVPPASLESNITAKATGGANDRKSTIGNSGNNISAGLQKQHYRQTGKLDKVPANAVARSNNNRLKANTVVDSNETTPADAAVSVKGALQTIQEKIKMDEIAASERLAVTSLNKQLRVIKQQTAVKKKYWEWGIGAGAGASALNKGISTDAFSEKMLEGNFQQKSNVQSYPTTGGNTLNDALVNVDYLNGNGNYLAAAMPPPASPVKTGMAWNAGGFAKYHLSEKWALTGGLEYTHFTTIRTVGAVLANNPQNNSVSYQNQFANARYAATTTAGVRTTSGDGQNFTNRYHFIQLPVGVEWQLTNNKQFPLIVDAGVSIGYMAGTNALFYKASTGLFYEDKSLYNKLQMGFQAGVQAKLFAQTVRPLYVGPVVQYNATSLTKSYSETRQNFMYAGLRLQWVLATTGK